MIKLDSGRLLLKSNICNKFPFSYFFLSSFKTRYFFQNDHCPVVWTIENVFIWSCWPGANCSGSLFPSEPSVTRWSLVWGRSSTIRVFLELTIPFYFLVPFPAVILTTFARVKRVSTEQTRLDKEMGCWQEKAEAVKMCWVLGHAQSFFVCWFWHL